ncbi:unnamed protein product [Oncorhynchus mykiss]|uniref:Uncharacterized protein n=1 Tax=Oncorhynchus mykiss TaxID=8022 RepID=A0A060Y766_ONCMY|nr:unnamed protein product [Oncorhynchus mykiss]
MQYVHLSKDSCRNGSIIRLLCPSQTAVCIVNGEANLLNTSFTDNHNATETGLSAVGNNWTNYNFWTGLTLAVLSAFLIGGSVMLKKKALLRLANNGQTRAGGGLHCLMMWKNTKTSHSTPQEGIVLILIKVLYRIKF